MSWSRPVVPISARWLVVVSLALTAMVSRPARAAEAPVVAVLYFDNNTGDASLDVLQKGFADMLITDMAAIPDVVVVERDKLQELLDELALQKTSYFDKKTAVKLGKGLGARYAVTGSFAAATPKLRIDVRLIDIATGKIVVTSKVTGPQTEIFDLEQQLVDQFAAAIKRKFSPSPQALTRVADMATVVDYSKGIDQADRGDFKLAAATLGSVVRKAPTFALARSRHLQVQAELKALRERRDDSIADNAAALAKNARAYLAANDLKKLDQAASKHYLAYRITLSGVLIRELFAELAGRNKTKVFRPGREAKAQALVKAYVDNVTKLITELELYAKRHTKTLPNGMTYLDTSLSLPVADQALATRGALKVDLEEDPGEWKAELARFFLLGECDDGTGGDRYILVPTPGDTNPAYLKRGYALVHEALVQARAALAANPALQPWPAVRLLQLEADAHFLRDETDAGVAKLQQILDDYPNIRNYDLIERNIKKQVGLERDNTVAARTRYVQGLQSCVESDLRVGVDATYRQRIRSMGLAALEYTEKEIERACAGNAKAKKIWEYLYAHLALEAAKYDDCTRFDAYMSKYLAAGGSASSEAGYRRNYSICP